MTPIHASREVLQQLTVLQGLEAMRLYLELHLAHGDDLGILVSDLTLDADGRTHDPAAWEDWLGCVERARVVADG